MSNSIWLPKQFLEGQNVPDVDIESESMDEFYAEHLMRSFEGYSYGGHRMTADHYWYLNFWRIRLNLPNPILGRKPISKMGFPLWCQADDYLFKQLEEADQAGLIAMLFTGRGFGKTYDISSIFGRGYVTNPMYRGILSAAVEKHVNNTWKYFKESLGDMEKHHEYLRQRRRLNSEEFIQAGYTDFDERGPVEYEHAMIEKVLYDKEPGKTRGRRLDGQLFEEGGDWNCPATLKQCIMASLGSWKVGAIVKVRAFIIGTGGSVKSADAKELFLDPDTYSIYAVKDHSGRKTAIFYPTMDKCGMFYEKAGPVLDPVTHQQIGYIEQDGIPDKKGAEAWLDRERAKLEGDPTAQKLFIQEYPKNWIECFERSGAAWFNRTKLSSQMTELTMTNSIKPAQRGYLKRMERHHIKTIEFIPDPEGPFWVSEPPLMDEEGRTISVRHGYIGGLDSIDQAKFESASPDGSKLALLIKKRQGKLSWNGNKYVAGYFNRPDGPVDIAWEDALMLLEWYDCQVNLEHSKISIVPHFTRKGAYWRFIKRPKVFQTEKELEDFGTLHIGTPMNSYTISYMVGRMKTFVEHRSETLTIIPQIEQLLEYDPERQTEFDWVVAMGLCEIADEDLIEYEPEEVKAPVQLPKYGWYTDRATGFRKHGIIPGSGGGPQTSAQLVAHESEKAKKRYAKGTIYVTDNNGDSIETMPVHDMIRRSEW